MNPFDRQREIENANRKFRREYSDIVDDPRSFGAAQNLAAQKLRTRPNADPAEIAAETGEEMRELMRDADRQAAIEIMKNSRGQNRKDANR